MEFIKIGILVFNGVTALDAVGPYEVLSELPNAQISFLSIEVGTVESTGGLKLIADHTIYEETGYDIIIIPGGSGIKEMVNNKDVLQWLKKVHINSKYTASVCTGALLLGKAGLLKGLKATTHWIYLDELKGYDSTPVKERYVQQGKIITSAGVSAGIDMSLKLAELITNPKVAQAIQLGIEYDPEPPYNSGSPEKASEEIVNLVKSKYEKNTDR